MRHTIAAAHLVDLTLRGQRALGFSPAQVLLVLLASPPAIVALYLAKSALGINLMPGPSPLHDLLYHLVR